MSPDVRARFRRVEDDIEAVESQVVVAGESLVTVNVEAGQEHGAPARRSLMPLSQVAGMGVGAGVGGAIASIATADVREPPPQPAIASAVPNMSATTRASGARRYSHARSVRAARLVRKNLHARHQWKRNRQDGANGRFGRDGDDGRAGA